MSFATAGCAGVWGFDNLTAALDAGEDVRGDAGGALADVGSDADAAPVADGGQPDVSCPCVTDLSGVGLADFYVQFDVTTTSLAVMPLGLQWSTCDATMPFWSVYSRAGLVDFAFGGGGGYDEVKSTSSIADGVKHHVVASRVSGVSAVEIDGFVVTGGAGTPQTLAALPPLEIGVDTCSTPAFVGTIDKVCLSTPCRVQYPPVGDL